MNDNFLSLKATAPKIIKRKNQKTVSGAFRNLIKHQILSAEEGARQIVQSAQNAAARTIAEAEAEAESIRSEAYRTGRDEAESELIENLLAIREARLQVLATIERDILKLSVKLAEKIVGREIRHDENTRGEIILNALRSARQQEMLTVRVNANDLPLLEQMRERVDAFGRAKYIDFIADQAVKDGGCIIESASGTIDTRLETQLRLLENALLARVSSEARTD